MNTLNLKIKIDKSIVSIYLEKNSVWNYNYKFKPFYLCENHWYHFRCFISEKIYYKLLTIRNVNHSEAIKHDELKKYIRKNKPTFQITSNELPF